MSEEKTYEVFTISNTNIVNTSTEITDIGGYEVPVISVGEEGRGRKKDVLPIPNTEEGESVKFVSLICENGDYILEKENNTNQKDEIILVLKPKHGFRGGVNFGGRFQRKYKCPEFHCDEVFDNRCDCLEHMFTHNDYSEYKLTERDKELIRNSNSISKEDFKYYYYFYDGKRELNESDFTYIATKFPSVKVLAKGMIADGAAGRVSSNRQFICILPKNVIISFKRTGRLYGNPPKWEVWWDGEKLHCMTPEDREMLTNLNII